MTPEPTDIVKGLLGIIAWMSAAPAFHENGEARVGWLRAQGEINVARAWLARAEEEKP